MAKKPYTSKDAETSVGARPIRVEKPANAKSPEPEIHTRKHLEGHQGPGTDHHYDNPADASKKDVAKAIDAPEHSAPAPFRKRDHLPDITSESVTVRMLADYWPADVERHEKTIRARKGELVAFPSDEALRLIEAGIAKREIDD